MKHRLQPGRTADDGSITVELVVLVPAFALMLALVLLVGRMQSSRADVEAAAHAAARSITLSRDPAVTTEIARSDTAERLQVGSRSCRSMDWTANLTATDATVSVSCEVDLAEAAILPVPGSFTVSATASEVFDQYVEARQ